MLSAIAAQIYLIIYILMFASALRLRHTQPTVRRGFVAPAIQFWAILGILASVFAFFLGFVPPDQYKTLSPLSYVSILLIGLVVFAIPPFVFYAKRQHSWQVIPTSEAEKNTAALQDLASDGP